MVFPRIAKLKKNVLDSASEKLNSALMLMVSNLEKLKKKPKLPNPKVEYYFDTNQLDHVGMGMGLDEYVVNSGEVLEWAYYNNWNENYPFPECGILTRDAEALLDASRGGNGLVGEDDSKKAPAKKRRKGKKSRKNKKKRRGAPQPQDFEDVMDYLEAKYSRPRPTKKSKGKVKAAEKKESDDSDVESISSTSFLDDDTDTEEAGFGGDGGADGAAGAVAV